MTERGDVARTDIPAILREQREYYFARAPEYDDAYRRSGMYDRGPGANASWQADLAELSTAFGFWLCHVPDERIAVFLRAVADSLRPEGVVCFVDKAAQEDGSVEQRERKLNDGRRFAIIEHPRRPHELVDRFEEAGLSIEVKTIGRRFCLGRGRRT